MPVVTLSPTERRQWAGIGAGAVVVVVVWLIVWLISFAIAPKDLSGAILIPVSVFAGGVVAGILSPGGWRSGAVSGLLSCVFAVSVLELYILAQVPLAAAAGWHFEPDLTLTVFGIVGFIVLPVAILGGALGGSLGRLARARGARGDL
ncbi:MAG: hypothetical protein ABFC38_06475 [Methanospirillum sp.]